MSTRDAAALRVDHMLTSEVGKFGNIYSLSSRVLGIETGQIIKSISMDHEGGIEGMLKHSALSLIQ